MLTHSSRHPMCSPALGACWCHPPSRTFAAVSCGSFGYRCSSPLRTSVAEHAVAVAIWCGCVLTWAMRCSSFLPSLIHPIMNGMYMYKMSSCSRVKCQAGFDVKQHTVDSLLFPKQVVKTCETQDNCPTTMLVGWGPCNFPCMIVPRVSQPILDDTSADFRQSPASHAQLTQFLSV